MKVLRKRAIWILLTVFLLPVLLFGLWYGRQVRQQRLDHALIAAIKKEDTKTAIVLLNEGADANAVDKPFEQKTVWSVLKEFWNRSKANSPKQKLLQYHTALMIAIWGYRQGNKHVLTSDNPALVKALLEHKANPNVCNEVGTTPLMLSCYYHRRETIQLLLEHGANPNAKGKSGHFALMMVFAMYSDDVMPCLPLLIEYGADVNATDMQNSTALICYVLFNSPGSSVEPVRYLLQQGAKVSVIDANGKTALDYSREFNDKALLHLLEAALQKEQAEQKSSATTATK